MNGRPRAAVHSQAPVRSGGEGELALRLAIGRVAQAREAKQHHGPGRRFGDRGGAGDYCEADRPIQPEIRAGFTVAPVVVYSPSMGRQADRSPGHAGRLREGALGERA